MTFSDMFGVFFGQPGSLNHLRGPLQTFVRQRCLHDTEPTDANFNKATDDLVEEITSEFEEAVVRLFVKFSFKNQPPFLDIWLIVSTTGNDSIFNDPNIFYFDCIVLYMVKEHVFKGEIHYHYAMCYTFDYEPAGKE